MLFVDEFCGILVYIKFGADVTSQYEDKMITDNEVQYMNRLVDILNKTVENVYNEKNGAYDINTLNDNLRAVDRLLKDPENSPYLLIRYDP